jgi:hypothetical protein
MREVSDDFLLNMAQVSAQLVGLFLVGVFFFVETGFGRAREGNELVIPYFRASTKIVLALYAIPIFLSLSLVVLEPVWSRALFAVMSAVLLLANYDTLARMWDILKVRSSPMLLANELIGTVMALVLVVIPWVLGGLDPSREDLTWSILLSFVAGFLSVGTMVLSAFDVARSESADGGRDEP